MAPRTTTRALRPAAAAGVLPLALLLALTGCSRDDGGSAAPAADGTAASGSEAASTPTTARGELTIPEDADEATRQQYVQENALAACMRKKGFTYTPHVTDWGAGAGSVDGQDYEQAKKYRDKYGFGLYAVAVYPNDPDVPGSRAHEAQVMENPDRAYLDALPPAQREAYDKAMGTAAQVNGKKVMLPGCMKDAMEKAYGPQKSQAELDRERAANEERDRAARQALNGDPQLVSLAQRFASCLRAEGIAVTTTQPTAIGDMVKFATAAQLPQEGVQKLDPDTARAKLAQEIVTARKDLACGKDFRAAYFPKLAKHPFSGITG